ncbi:nucleoredoxin-like protein 2 [Amblyomma americanum]
MASIFSGKMLIKKDGKLYPADEALRDKQLICLYFAAHWCPPCRMFTPVLANVYKVAKGDNLAIEVIFISADRNKNDMLNYMKTSHGDWYGLPFDDPLQGEVEERFKVVGVPTLLVMKADGTMVCANGKKVVQERGVQAFRDWLGN